MMERRRKKRHDLVCKVLYSTDENPKEISAKSFNVSLNGIGLNLKELIKGENLNLKIFSPRASEPIEVKGRLVWQTHLPERNAKLAGVKLTETSWSDAELASRLGTI